jgi:hypothetical protein
LLQLPSQLQNCIFNITLCRTGLPDFFEKGHYSLLPSVNTRRIE